MAPASPPKVGDTVKIVTGELSGESAKLLDTSVATKAIVKVGSTGKIVVVPFADLVVN